MPRYRLSPQAEQDILAILEWTHESFGEKVRRRDEALLTRAILDVADNPERAGSRARPELAVAARTYHLRYSRDRVRKSIGAIHRPRHFLVYRAGAGDQVDIGRVLHDGMDLRRNLPDEIWHIGYIFCVGRKAGREPVNVRGGCTVAEAGPEAGEGERS